MTIQKLATAIAVTLFTCLPKLFAADLPCKGHEPGCAENFYRHFQVLESGFARAAKENSNILHALGDETETAYHGAWIQRFEGGLMVHLSQRVPFVPATLESHEGSTFVVRYESPASSANPKEKGQFFYQWTPRVTGIYDVDLFKSILSSYPPSASRIGWSAGKKLADVEIVSMFRPHTESSPKNLSGGLAVMYAMYRLDQFIGRPLEQQFTQTLLRKTFKNGYLLIGLPSPRETAGPGAKLIYAFKTAREPKGDPNTDHYAGGKKFRAGAWRTFEFDPGEDEEKFRPKRGLFRD